MDINDFSQKIPNFQDLSSAQKIDFLMYFLLIFEKRNGIKPRDIEACFTNLHEQPYSNVSAYLRNGCLKGKNQKFLKGKDGYLLLRKRKEAIDQIVQNVTAPKPSDDLFPQSLLNNTRTYLVKTSEQASVCYDLGLYDASLVMIRKLLETLIIECFERHKIEARIKGPSGHFYFLSDLITHFVAATEWNLSRNTTQSLPRIKKLGDLSAHNRRYSAKKPDIEKIKDDLRIVIQETINIIDFPNWK